MSKKDSKYSRLELAELQTIFMMRREGKTFQQIGDNLKRSKSCVNKATRLYRPANKQTWCHMSPLERAKYVHDRMQVNSKTKKTFSGQLKDQAIRDYVYEGLVNKHQSPEQISAKLNQEAKGKSISFKTIYNYTKNNPELKQYLYEKGKKRRQNISGRRSRFKEGAPLKRSIHEREDVVNDRQRLGDWEGDTIVSCRRGKGAILSLVERRTREKFFRKVVDLKSKTIFDFLLAFLMVHPNVKTITLDNGTEFSYSELIELEKRYLGLKIYYCDSYKSYQKGSVERSNRDFRRYYPKGTDFKSVCQTDVIKAQNNLNSMPLKIHGFRSPLEFKNEFINKATCSQLAA